MLSSSNDKKPAVRLATLEDIPKLRVLEKVCWLVGLRVTKKRLTWRISHNPQGQRVMELSSTVVAVIYSQRIQYVDDLKTTNFLTADTLHQPAGSILHVLSLNVLPDQQDHRYGEQLLEQCSSMEGAEKIVGVTRCKDYEKHSDISLAEYINPKNAQGRYVDTVLRLHQFYGADILELIPAYRPKDIINQGYGGLLGDIARFDVPLFRVSPKGIFTL